MSASVGRSRFFAPAHRSRTDTQTAHCADGDLGLRLRVQRRQCDLQSQRPAARLSAEEASSLKCSGANRAEQDAATNCAFGVQSQCEPNAESYRHIRQFCPRENTMFGILRNAGADTARHPRTLFVYYV